jgi:pimeloyl-ACP methyl ester carboxylesterase
MIPPPGPTVVIPVTLDAGGGLMTRDIRRRWIGFGASVAILAGASVRTWAQQQPTPAKVDEAAIRFATAAGELHGTIDLPGGAGPFPVVVIIAGSGPTDRDGNQPFLKNDSLKQLGRGISARGIAAVRYDKRGIAASAAAGPKEKDLRFEMLVDDAARLVERLRDDRRFSRVGVVGHSEGALVGMLAAKRSGARAFVSMGGLGRRAPEVLREQLGRNLPPEMKELRAKSDHLIDELAAGRTVADPPKELNMLFRPSVQDYLISYFRYDPSREIAGLEMPALIVQGTTDLQTPVDDARRLAAAKPGSRLLLVDGMNHVLKRATTPEEQRMAYTDPSVPLATGLVEGIATFLDEATARD